MANILRKFLIPLHRAKNVVVHLYYSFQLCPLAVAWQSERLKVQIFWNFTIVVFAFLAHPVGKQIMQFAAG